jgi:hypothetical protein
LVNSGTTLDEFKRRRKKIYGHFRHDSFMAHTINLSVAILRELFADGLQLMVCVILDYQIGICVIIFCGAH